MSDKKTLLERKVERFLAWDLPSSVAADVCATQMGRPGRTGTNLLTAKEAHAMFEHACADERREIADLLCNLAQLLDVVRIEWGDAWSLWDQEQRDHITRLMAEYMPYSRGELEREHTNSADCWCSPTLDYVDSETGSKVYVHHKEH